MTKLQPSTSKLELKCESIHSPWPPLSRPLYCQAIGNKHAKPHSLMSKRRHACSLESSQILSSAECLPLSDKNDHRIVKLWMMFLSAASSVLKICTFRTPFVVWAGKGCVNSCPLSIRHQSKEISLLTQEKAKKRQL